MGHAIGWNAGFKGALAPEDHHGAGQAAIDLVAESGLVEQRECLMSGKGFLVVARNIGDGGTQSVSSLLRFCLPYTGCG